MTDLFIASLSRPAQAVVTESDLRSQRAFFAAHPALAPTPLLQLPALARTLGLGGLAVKDETLRFGLNAFKATGALFAVATLVARGALRPGSTVVCASEGNHGRAVARAAREAGCAARVYVSSTVAPARVRAIAAEGATVVTGGADYDEAMRRMTHEAVQAGWTIVSDTATGSDTETPRLIMAGYTRVMDEVVETLGGDARPDVILVQAGVGGLLAATASWAHWQYGPRRPRLVSVEPRTAACALESARRGQPTVVPGPFDSALAGLRCGVLSSIVFETMASLVDAFVGIDDAWAFDAQRRLSAPLPGDPAVSAGPAGAAGLGGLLALWNLAEGRPGGPVDLAGAQVLVLATEGA